MPALLSVDNIVAGSWQTEGMRRHEIIQRRPMCSSDRGREGDSLLSGLPPALWAALPAYYTAFHEGLSHPCMHSLLQLLLIPFILLLCCFLTDCPTGPDSQDLIAAPPINRHASLPPNLDSTLKMSVLFIFFNQPFILTACDLVHWLLFFLAST